MLDIMSSVWKCLITFLITALLASGAWFFVMHMRTEKIVSEYEGEISQLTATLDALGPAVECYSVTEEFAFHYDNDVTGQIITSESIMPITVPSSLVSDSYITDTSQIIGKYCKVNIKPGTLITNDVIMGEWYDDTLRDVDIVVDARVVGLRVGDYVDIRITLPYGEDYTVLSHKRVQQINERSLKFYLDESEWQLWQSATVDYYLNSASGCRIYVTKYIEPGVQIAATEWYAPSSRVASVIRDDPNITMEAQRYLAALGASRSSIDSKFNEFITDQTTTQQQAGLLSAGRASWSADVLSDYRTVETDRLKNISEDDTYIEEEVAINFDNQYEDEEGESEGAASSTSVYVPETSTFQEETATYSPIDTSIEETSAVTDETMEETTPTRVLPEVNESIPESQAPVTEPEETLADADTVG